MPTYDYECRKCGHFERVQKMTDPPLKRCPKCKGAVRRKIGGGAGLIFKGSGFYITDYRSEGYKKAAKSESDSGPAKTETKTAPKPGKADSSAK
jgi:putative FmdB family regulatory protein